jgi:hypothetical protein
LIFRNQNPAYTVKKGKETLIYWPEWIHLLVELHCCTGFNQHGSFCTTTVPPLFEGKCALLLWVLRSLLRCMHCTLSPVRTPALAADSEACQYLVLSLVAQVEIVVDSEVSLLLPRARVDAARITEQQRCQDMWRQKRTR